MAALAAAMHVTEGDEARAGEEMAVPVHVESSQQLLGDLLDAMAGEWWLIDRPPSQPCLSDERGEQRAASRQGEATSTRRIVAS